MTCSVNHSTIATKFCSVCGAPSTSNQAPAQPPQWNQPPAQTYAPQPGYGMPAQPYIQQPYAQQPYVQQPVYKAPSLNLQEFPYPLASKGKRIGAFAIDYGFGVVAPGLIGLLAVPILQYMAYIGVFIWTLVTMSSGKTPGKLLLKMTTYNTVTKRPATWGHMAIRQILIPLSLYMLFIPALIASANYQPYYDYYDYGFQSYALLAFGALFLVAAAYITELVFMLVSQTNQGLRDRWVKTVILDEGVISNQYYPSQGAF